MPIPVVLFHRIPEFADQHESAQRAETVIPVSRPGTGVRVLNVCSRENGAERAVTQRRYALLVRVTHWINAVALIDPATTSFAWIVARPLLPVRNHFPAFRSMPVQGCSPLHRLMRIPVVLFHRIPESAARHRNRAAR